MASRTIERGKTTTARLLSILKNKYFLLALELAIALSLVGAGLYVRLSPFYTTGTVINYLEARYSSLLGDIDNKLFYYGYLFGNDPWIEYWLSNYLYHNGVQSWVTLKRENPATHIFWYPWGRDFTDSEYPFIPAITAMTYAMFKPNMSLQQWASLLPPIAALVMMIAGYIYVRRLYGPLAAVIALAFLALLPASIDRTHAGFVEKEGIAMPMLVLGLLFLSLSIANIERRLRSLIYAILSGLSFGLIAFTWGGYLLPSFIIASTALWLPLALRDDERYEPYLTVLLVGAIFYLVGLFTAELYTKVYLVPPLILAIGGPVLGYLLFLLATRMAKTAFKLPRIIATRNRIYFTVLLVLIVMSIAALPYIGIRGRLFYTIAWPLRGSIHFHPLLESVAEHQPVIGSASFIEINGVLFTGLLGALIIVFYTSVKYKRKDDIPLGLISLGALYSTLGLAYLLQTAGVLGSLSSSALIGIFTYPLSGAGRQRKRRRHGRGEIGEIARTLLVLVLLLLVSLVLFNAYLASARTSRVSGFLTSNTAVPNPGWLLTLDYLEKTPPDTVVVTWWDYGYWVSVGTGRPTLADGATINSTQIELLAKILVSDENTSTRIMKEFGLKPNKTLVIAHDIVDVTSDGRAFYQGAIDIPKSYWMVRIAGAHDPKYQVPDYFQPVNIGNGRILPMITSKAKGAANALIYRILADAVKHLEDKGLAITDKRIKVYESYLSLYDYVNHVPANTTLKHFKPAKVIAFTLGSYKFPTGEQVTRYILIAIYQWTG